ncbi:hypothetical protein O988_05848 [Pseudogymnoascus sp. VKM F-3808]|nr:hypothetical protein O988_05848 [Pseudogymnoascus sp. VKM F-3808]
MRAPEQLRCHGSDTQRWCLVEWATGNLRTSLLEAGALRNKCDRYGRVASNYATEGGEVENSKLPAKKTGRDFYISLSHGDYLAYTKEKYRTFDNTERTQIPEKTGRQMEEPMTPLGATVVRSHHSTAAILESAGGQHSGISAFSDKGHDLNVFVTSV